MTVIEKSDLFLKGLEEDRVLTKEEKEKVKVLRGLTHKESRAHQMWLTLRIKKQIERGVKMGQGLMTYLEGGYDPPLGELATAVYEEVKELDGVIQKDAELCHARIDENGEWGGGDDAHKQIDRMVAYWDKGYLGLTEKAAS